MDAGDSSEALVEEDSEVFDSLEGRGEGSGCCGGRDCGGGGGGRRGGGGGTVGISILSSSSSSLGGETSGKRGEVIWLPRVRQGLSVRGRESSRFILIGGDSSSSGDVGEVSEDSVSPGSVLKDTS